MMSFEEFFYNTISESYIQRNSDIWFHGSPIEFDNIRGSDDGLVYLTQNINLAWDYASKYSAFTRDVPGFLYAYKIKTDAKIFDATDNENIKKVLGKNLDTYFGYTEIVQTTPGLITDILHKGYDGVYQRMASPDRYGNLIGKRIKTRQKYIPGSPRDKVYVDIPREKFVYGETPYKGNAVIGIKPSTLIFLGKKTSSELLDMYEKSRKTAILYKNFKGEFTK